MRLKLILSKPEFLLNAYASVTDFNIHIQEITFYIRRVMVNPSVIKWHMIGLNTQNALYPVQHTKLMTFTIPKDHKSFMKDGLFPSVTSWPVQLKNVLCATYNLYSSLPITH